LLASIASDSNVPELVKIEAFLVVEVFAKVRCGIERNCESSKDAPWMPAICSDGQVEVLPYASITGRSSFESHCFSERHVGKECDFSLKRNPLQRREECATNSAMVAVKGVKCLAANKR